MQLAQLHLPGLPGSARRIRDRATREHWLARPARQRGGGVEYHVASLPPVAQLALAGRWTEGAAAQPTPLKSAPAVASNSAPSIERPATLNDLPGWARDRAVARGEILASLREYLRHAAQPVGEALPAFVAAYNASEIIVTDATRLGIPLVSAESLRRWRRALKVGGSVALAGNHGSRRGSGILDNDPAMRDVVLAMVAQFGAHLRIPRVHEALVASFPAAAIPSLGAVGRFVRRWRKQHPSLALAMHNPDRWKSSHRMKIADAGEHISRLNQEWQIDGTPGDILLADGRHHILALIDVYSRRALFHVASSESSAAAIRLICRAIVAWGVPEIIHGDNGSGFVSDFARRFLDDLAIEYVASPPFRPETKPFVESVIATMSHQLLAMLPGFSGHSVAQRQELRARTSFAARFGAPPQKVFRVELTAAELQAKLDSWAVNIYGERPHSGLAGKSPQAVAGGWTGQVRRIEDERALAMLAEEAVARRIGREGIQIAGARFVPTAATVAAYASHIGETALVFPDPAGDMGVYHVFVDTPAGREFIATIKNIARLGVDRSDLALLARQAQDKFIRDGRATMRRIRNRIKPETIIDTVLEHAAGAASASGIERGGAGESASRDFDSDAVIHQTAALAAAAIADETALIARVAPQPVVYDADTLARADALIAESEMTSSRFLSDDELYELWKDVRAARAAGIPVDADRAEYADRFEGSAAWETRLMLDDDCDIALRRTA